jgi:hypothetical protein
MIITTIATGRDTEYATELGAVAGAYPDGDEARLERIRIKTTGVVEIRLSWWKHGRLIPRPLDIPVADFLDLVKAATLAGLLSARDEPEPPAAAPPPHD